ncbi:MAG TPA: hypothetical protein DIU15_12370, partial [Deltaproteobacteria bacterium]|nr:hypothetical protein [Deltaproteobacteria bacterium]
PDESDDPDEPDVVVDDDAAIVVSASFPAQLDCGATAMASVVVENTGAVSWTRAEGYKLGAVDDEDPFYSSDTRIWLADGDEVLSGSTHTFSFLLEAPAEPGLYLSDWQMVHEAVQWFGDVTTHEVEVTCVDDAPPPATGPPDLSTVTWLHTDVSQWPQTATLSSVTMSGPNICLDYDQANAWPVFLFNGTAVVGNPWIFIWQDNQWYGATWEWLRPGQTCKAASSVAGDHIKQDPFGQFSGWVPTSGTTYWFMVSGLARTSDRNVEVRTNLVPLVWP